MRPQIQRARELRRNMSDVEILLWSRLKRLRDLGFHVRRQAPFRGYVLDFVCFSRRVVIEVDGSQHADDLHAEHDAIRDRILQREGFQVLRFTARDVRQNLRGVTDHILWTLHRAASTRGPPASAERERDSPTLAAARPFPPH